MSGSKRIKIIKKGKLFDSGLIDAPWADSYTQCPTALLLDDCIRLFFNTRSAQDSDGNYVSYITYVDLDRAQPEKIINIAREPILGPGEVGCFDHFGVGVSSALKVDNKIYLYYSGWQRCLDIPYVQSIGLAISEDGGDTFTRHSNGPIISQNISDPYYVTTPSVFLADGKFHCIYMSGTDWVLHENKYESIYTLKYAQSENGIDWVRNKAPILKRKDNLECLAVPSILQKDNDTHLFFSYRPGLNFRNNNQNGYKIGYANSSNLEIWQRNDTFLNCKESSQGWDSDMMCYPNLCEIDGKILMFYCGNYFGRDGIGYAEVEF